MSFTPETLLRHWQTLRLIPKLPRKITAGDICQALMQEGYEVGKRTVERDLQALSRIFPLLVDERSKPFGWSWNKDAPAFDLPGMCTSEALTLLMAKEHLKAVMPATMLKQMEGYFRLAEQKIKALDGHSTLADWFAKVRILQPSQPLLEPRIDDSVQAVIQEALLLDRQCEIAYRKRDNMDAEIYPINPLGLVQRGRVLYVVCTIKNHDDLRLLALHRIQSATMLDGKVRKPKNFSLDGYLASGIFGWMPGDSIRLRAMFAKDAGSHLLETPLSEDQRVEFLTDGQLHVTATVQQTEQLVWWLLAFGDKVEVLAPAVLRKRMAGITAKAAQRYAREA